VIVMRAKGVEFDVTYIDLLNPPDWFRAISPHEQVPVLKVGDTPLFESSAIAEFIDETVAPRLHPDDPIRRARNRAWTDYVPTFAGGLSSCYYAKTAAEQQAGFEQAREVLAALEGALEADQPAGGPYFNGPTLSLVDAAYAPFLMRFAMVDARMRSGLLDGFPRVKAWSQALLASPTVTGSVHESFPTAFVALLQRRQSVAAPLFAAVA
jgi:glutathione S-transferase